MPAEVKTRTVADDQAANWIARLGTRTISLDTIQKFARWREDPANAEAYRRAEQLWSRTGELAGDPDIQAALAQAQSRSPRRFGAKQIAATGLTTALAASLAVGAFFWQIRDTYATEVGEQRSLQLADGSRVRLDTASKIRIRFTEGERRIELAEGQAFFEVAHNPARPFVVSTSDASVTAVGTVFEVRHVGSETRVVLVSGAVDVVQAATKGAPQRLLPNQQTAIKSGKAKVSTVNADTATSWTEGELTFVDTPLAEAVAEVTYGSERTFDGSRGMIHSSNLQEALGNTANNPATAFSAPRDGYLNLFGSGAANSRTVLDFISNGWNRYTDESEVASVNLIAQGTAFKLPAGDLKVAVGAQFRTEGLKNSGVTFTSGLAPLFTRSPDKDRKVTATFLEVRAPLIGPDQAIPGVQKLELSLAGRLEDYDDIGSTTNPKIGLMWTPVEDLKIRANWGTSFRAPAMTELAQRRYISATFVADTVGQQVALFEGGGNPDLKPETADTFTFGFDYRPKDRSWRFGATWFDIAFSDQIGSPARDNLSHVLLDPNLAPFVRRIDRNSAADRAAVDALINSPDFLLPGVLPADAFGVIVDARWLNTSSVEVRGLDGYAAYDLDLAGGELTLEATASYMTDYKRRITSTAPTVDVVDTYGFPVDLRGTVSGRWVRDDVSLRVAVNHVGGSRDLLESRIGSWTTTDMQVGWTPSGSWGEGLSLTASVRNVFDADPPFYDAITGIGFDAGQADPLGRTFALQLTKRW